MRIAPLLVVLSACGRAPEPIAPAGAPALQLVRCAPARPLPRSSVELEGGPAERGELLSDLADPAQLEAWMQPGGVPAVTAGPPAIAGSLDASIVIRLVAAQLPQLRACYERALPDEPGLAGTVSVGFTVTPDGRVTTTRAISLGINASVSACVVRVIQALQFPTGHTVIATYPFQFAIRAASEPGDLPVALRTGAPWTPFALDDRAPPTSAPIAARAVESAMRAGLASLARCFTGAAPVGSLRVMLALQGGTSIVGVRAGGLGDVAAESCVARGVGELQVASSSHDTVEVACDLSRGEAQPWRLAPAGYAVIEVGRRDVRQGEVTITPGALAPPLLRAGQTFLVVAQPDTPGELLDLALTWAEQGDATLIAVRDGPSALRFVGVARTAHQIGSREHRALRPALRVGAVRVTACFDRGRERALLADPSAVDTLVARIAARCRAVRCSASLGVAIDPDATASQVAEVAGAARRAGFERVLLGAGPGCPDAR